MFLRILLLFTVSGFSFADEYPGSWVQNHIQLLSENQEVDISTLRPGQLKRIKWAGHQIIIYRRTADEIESLEQFKITPFADPHDFNLNESIRKAYWSSVSGPWVQTLVAGSKLSLLPASRSLRKEFFIAETASPHSGCSLTFKSNKSIHNATFYDPCSSVSYDHTGRSFKGIAKTNTSSTSTKYNLQVVPHTFKPPNYLSLGIPGGHKSLPSYEFDHTVLYKNKSAVERLKIAARYNDLEMFEKSLDSGVVNLDFFIKDQSILHSAIVGSRTSIVKLLLNLGVVIGDFDVDTANKLGRSDVVKLINIRKKQHEKSITRHSKAWRAKAHHYGQPAATQLPAL